MKIINKSIKNSFGELLQAKLYMPNKENFSNFPLVIMLTGDGPSGSKSLSWTKLPPMLAEKNIASLTFDFSGLGDSEGNRKKLTLEKGIDDFKSILKLLNTLSCIDLERIGVLSSSFGSSVVIASGELRNVKAHGFKSPCAFLPEAYLNEIHPESFSKWNEEGYCDENGYNIEVLYNPIKYNIYSEAAHFSSSCLITHGLNDEIVPFRQSQLLEHQFLQNSKSVELILLQSCDHGYSQDGKWDIMAKHFIEFFSKML